MPKTRPLYPLEFKRQMIELVRAGQTPRELAQEFEPCYETICAWIRQADRDKGRSLPELSTNELVRSGGRLVIAVFFATLERELVDRHTFNNRGKTQMSVFESIEGCCDPQRCHSLIG